MPTVSNIAKRLHISAATVRNYAREFGDHLSPSATPPPGETRQFTDEDLQVLATARAMLAEGLSYEEVRERLAQGVHLVEVEPPPEAPQQTQETALVPVAALQLYVQPYVAERDRVLAERDALLQENKDLRDELGRVRGILEAQERGSWWRRLFGR